MANAQDKPLSFSLIIPTKNEALDIAETLEACLSIDYEHKEVIVVDDSTDETPRIVEGFADRGVRLIHREHNDNACCGARNLGARMATGDVVVIVNADAQLGSDFLRRLVPHYEEGADWVVVRSVAQNKDQIWGRYIWSGEMVQSERWYDRLWSKGFSCRRSALEKVGYIPGDFAVPFCRDNMLGIKFSEAGLVKHLDTTIIAGHVCPKSFGEYWGIQIHRGAHHAPFAYYFRGMSLPQVAALECARAVYTFFKVGILVPILYRAIRRGRHAGWRYVPELFFAGVVTDVGGIVGAFKGLSRLIRLRNKPAPSAAVVDGVA